MAEPVPRHFAMPFRWAGAGDKQAATTVQGDVAEIADCVELVVQTAAGQRLTLPTFGRPETLEFAVDDDLAAAQLQAAIDEAEPRARAIVEGEFDPADPAVLRLRAMFQPEEIR
jgi:predicted NBD/HSP70 family sugar kinase